MMTNGMVRVDWIPRETQAEERRESPRTPISLLVLHSGRSREAAFGTLGLRGCLFWANERFERDQILNLRLLLPDRKNTLDLRARVVRSGSPSLASRRFDTVVLFEDLSFETQREIARWLDENTASN